ncbi:hypothetical protein [Sulfurimonas sp.]|uniref:hypothetical protein n=1 Tax=Sulfurimonas sp. TaxID=2022749 RepID=UPI0025E00746|nr:hypothetical protein [Sulfurimonas sp.]
MKIYNYDKKTQEFLSQTNASANPLEKGKYLIPSNATIEKIIASKDGFTICFNIELNKWEHVEDNRGKTAYSTLNKQALEINYLGAIKEGFTLLKPKEFDKWDGLIWTENLVLKKEKELEKTKQNKNLLISKSTSEVHTILYDTDEKSMDRMNRIVSLANAEYNYRVSVGETPASAYEVTYKTQTIDWTGADNKSHKVMVESIVQALRAGMINMGEIWHGN